MMTTSAPTHSLVKQLNSASYQRLYQSGLAVLNAEAQALQTLAKRLDDSFVKACGTLLACQGRVIVTGMGKSGHIANKIAATLASTGTPAFFVHPGEASHGDLGMITADDVVIALSNSGTSNEVLTIIPIIKRLGCQLISLTGAPNSPLAKASSVHLNVNVAKEACPMNLAPTSSTTAALAMGDALAVALLDFKGFTAEDFARSHPGGKLGKRLLLRIEDVMETGNYIPKVWQEASVSDALLEMTRKGLGMTAIVNADEQPIGIFTDGDLRRAIEQSIDFKTAKIKELMTENCKTISENALATTALELMESYKINQLLVTNSADQLVGALNMHSLFKSGIV